MQNFEKANSLRRAPWYACGLHFECQGCGNCCSGPESGYIWANRGELESIAAHLRITAGELRKNYARRMGLRWTLIEQPINRDCVFLRNMNGSRGCAIYAVRPEQCRTWPFWASNLESPAAWNQAAQRCPGINRGRLYSAEEIQAIKKGRKRQCEESPQTSSGR